MPGPEVNNPDNFFYKLINAAHNTIDGPITWFRESVATPNRPTYYWYHQKFPRVPTIDECYTDDYVCYSEANEQYKRDKRVDTEVLKLLRGRLNQCYFYENPDGAERCQHIKESYEQAKENFNIKYGDIGNDDNVRKAYMKQKHRMIWERRHGKVGTGMKPRSEWGE